LPHRTASGVRHINVYLISVGLGATARLHCDAVRCRYGDWVA